MSTIVRSPMKTLTALALSAGALIPASLRGAERPAPLASLFDQAIYYGDSHWGYRNGPGWSIAQVKRMARKRRNQQRHKLAVRRGKGRS